MTMETLSETVGQKSAGVNQLRKAQVMLLETVEGRNREDSEAWFQSEAKRWMATSTEWNPHRFDGYKKKLRDCAETARKAADLCENLALQGEYRESMRSGDLREKRASLDISLAIQDLEKEVEGLSSANGETEKNRKALLLQRLESLKSKLSII